MAAALSAVLIIVTAVRFWYPRQDHSPKAKSRRRDSPSQRNDAGFQYCERRRGPLQTPAQAQDIPDRLISAVCEASGPVDTPADNEVDCRKSPAPRPGFPPSLRRNLIPKLATSQTPRIRHPLLRNQRPVQDSRPSVPAGCPLGISSAPGNDQTLRKPLHSDSSSLPGTEPQNAHPRSRPSRRTHRETRLRSWHPIQPPIFTYSSRPSSG